MKQELLPDSAPTFFFIDGFSRLLGLWITSLAGFGFVTRCAFILHLRVAFD